MRIFLSFAFLFILGCESEGLTEHHVKRLMDDSKKAFESRDADKLRSLFAEDAQIEIAFPQTGNSGRLTLDDYITNTRKAWSEDMETIVEVRKLQIDIMHDKRFAAVSYTTLEKVLVRENITLSAVVDAELEIALIDGEAKIKDAYSRIALLNNP